MKPPHSTGRNVIAILAIPIVMLFLIVITPFSLGITSPFDLCGMVDASSRATSLSLSVAACFTKMESPPEVGSQSCHCSVRSTDAPPISALDLRR